MVMVRRGGLLRLIFLNGAMLWMLVGSAWAQGQIFFTSGPAVSYTSAQADRAKAVYTANCASCHGDTLDGGQFGPTLHGDAFKAHWSTQSSDALLAFMFTKMPPAAPGSLKDVDYADLEAYILQANGVPAGSGELALPRNMSLSTFQEINQDPIYKAVMAAREKFIGNLTPVTEAMLEHPADGDWLVWRRSYQNISFSPLKQVDKANVQNLGVAWSLTLPVSYNETTPLVHDGVLFVESGGSIQALNGKTGDFLWQYTIPAPTGSNININSRAWIKNLAIYGDKLYAATPEGHVIALEAKTGKLVWDHEVVNQGASNQPRLSGGPLVAKGTVIISTSLGGAHPGGNFVVGLDGATGQEKWVFNTIARPGQPGGDSWNGAPVEQRYGAGAWTSASYDPERDLIYFGVGNATYDIGTLMVPRDNPGGSNDALYGDSTIALNPETGKLAWFHQHMQRDVWDLDWVFEHSLITLPVNGKPTDVVVTGGKTAIFDVMDRDTGKYLFSRDLGLQNVVTSIDPVTGKEHTDPNLEPEAGKKKLLCPSFEGARNWPTTAFDPGTHILYVPLLVSCTDYTWTQHTAEQIAAGAGDIPAAQRPRPDANGNFGRIDAIDLLTGKEVWTHRQRPPVASSLLVTASGLLFAGSMDRTFVAYDAATGKSLWEGNLNAPPSSSPVTYTVDGQEYIAVVAGGGNSLSTLPMELAPEIKSPVGGTTLWVFKVPTH
jgi:alcohol dehydrogenase (cytochrome c)